MKAWQKIAIFLMLVVYLTIYYQKIKSVFESSAPTALTSEHLVQIHEEMWQHYYAAEKIIKAGVPNHSEFVKHEAWLILLTDSSRAYPISKTMGELRLKLTKDYLEMGKEYLDSNSHDDEMKVRIAQLHYTSFTNQLCAKRRDALLDDKSFFDWQRLFFLTHHFLLSFLPFILPILLFKRWHKFKPWQRGSKGDVICIVLSHLFGPIGALAYHPNGALQRGIDYQLEIWKQKIGATGWRLTVAYIIAFVIAVFTIFRSSAGKAHETNIQIVCMQDTEEREVSSEEEETFQFDVFFSQTVAVVSRFFEAVICTIRRIVRLLGVFITVKLNLPPPLKFIWGLWELPVQVTVSWLVKSFGSRAPAHVLLKVNSLNLKTECIGGYHESCSRFFNGFVG